MWNSWSLSKNTPCQLSTTFINLNPVPIKNKSKKMQIVGADWNIPPERSISGNLSAQALIGNFDRKFVGNLNWFWRKFWIWTKNLIFKIICNYFQLKICLKAGLFGWKQCSTILNTDKAIFKRSRKRLFWHIRRSKWLSERVNLTWNFNFRNHHY